MSAQKIGLWAGPVLAGAMVLFGAPEGLSMAAWATAALLVWMAIWWATEAIPIPVTSLLPMVILPLAGAGTHRTVAAGYASHIVMLLLGGFIIALGLERWNLHKRIALNTISIVGMSPRRLVLGFMVATALLSMWISNTATTLMMVPIALSAAAALGDDKGRFIVATMLGICYAASIGGVATPIGTPTNLIAINWLEEAGGRSIGFSQWMMFGLPAVFMLVPAAWWIVAGRLKAAISGRAAYDAINRQRVALGGMAVPEWRVLFVFVAVGCLWIFRLSLQSVGDRFEIAVLSNLSDMGIAIAGAVAMFLVPAGAQQNRALLTWNEAVKLPWGVLLLFGGGIALGNSVRSTGLSAWIGEQLSVLSALPTFAFIASVVLLIIFLTELTSNVATMNAMAPILGALSVAIGAAPESLLAPAAVAASCAFMLPVATAPNAIVYATGKVTMAQMMRHGVRLNLIAAFVITCVGVWLAPLAL